VVAGAVVGSIVLLAAFVAFFLRRRRRNATALQTSGQEVKDIPAPADTVLNRPDPSDKNGIIPPFTDPVHNESVVTVYANSTATINLVPSSPAPSSIHSNPFGDNHSIQTTSTGSQSTNVIPIAFVPPPASVHPLGSLPQASSTSLVHNLHSPLQLNMDHLNLSVESAHPKPVSPSGASTIPDDGSYISNASYASDVLSAVPTVVTGRHVASAAKAAVVPASSAKGLIRLPSIRSPLTGSSFGPQDIPHEADESHPLPLPHNPFADERGPPVISSAATQGFTQPPQDSAAAGDQHPSNAGSGANESSDRPLSTYTQAASLIGADIMDATRVHLGFAHPASASVASVFHGTPLPSSVMGGSAGLVRMASGRIVSPFTPNPLERQQESSMATMLAQAQQSEKVHAVPQRMSMSTMASGVSGRADSILESFTFVPPSPISNRPLRTPPRSPLVQETHHVQEPPLEPPNRRVLGMSTASQLSSMSTGLGSFPFQIDHGSEGNQTEDPVGLPTGQSVDKDEARASLDTLALTRDLTSSYPSR
jgi:hypothetical protein